jgi:PIN domain nuclease of toxin-antitoxin system
MRLLLDTHTFLWWVNESSRLSKRALQAIGDADRPCLFSVASCWEMAIKAGSGKLKLPFTVARFVSEQLAANGFLPLSIELAHAARVAELPVHHRDPFDRLLAAQALEEDLTIISADSIFKRYGVRRIW